MRRAGHVVIWVVLFGLLAGCQTMLGDFNKYGERYDPPPMSKVSIGDSRADVVAALGEPNSLGGVKQTEHGLEEILDYWQYKATFGRDEVATTYRVYLRNGKVTGWEAKP